MIFSLHPREDLHFFPPSITTATINPVMDALAPDQWCDIYPIGAGLVDENEYAPVAV
jgi:hypothetical protein